MLCQDAQIWQICRKSVHFNYAQQRTPFKDAHSAQIAAALIKMNRRNKFIIFKKRHETTGNSINIEERLVQSYSLWGSFNNVEFVEHNRKCYSAVPLNLDASCITYMPQISRWTRWLPQQLALNFKGTDSWMLAQTYSSCLPSHRHAASCSAAHPLAHFVWLKHLLEVSRIMRWGARVHTV